MGGGKGDKSIWVVVGKAAGLASTSPIFLVRYNLISRLLYSVLGFVCLGLVTGSFRFGLGLVFVGFGFSVWCCCCFFVCFRFIISIIVVFSVVVLLFVLLLSLLVIIGFVGSLGGDLLLNFLIVSSRLGLGCCCCVLEPVFVVVVCFNRSVFFCQQDQAGFPSDLFDLSCCQALPECQTELICLF